jgi:hypothetical protein
MGLPAVIPFRGGFKTIKIPCFAMHVFHLSTFTQAELGSVFK